MVDDGRNNNEMVTMINQDGCALDRFVLTNLEYPTDLIAGQVGMENGYKGTTNFLCIRIN